MLCQVRSVVVPTVLGLIALLLIACSATQAAGPSTTPTPSASPSPSATPIPSPSPPPSFSEADFAAALAKWRAAGFANYTYKLEIGCFCFFEHGMPITVTVLNGEANSMTWSDGTAVANPELSYETFAEASTIDRLFAELDQLRRTAYYVKATFDPVYGFPTTAFIDRVRNLADEENSYTISALRAIELPRTGGRP